MGEGYLSVAEDAAVEGHVVPPAVIGRRCTVAPDARVGSLVVLGDGVRVGAGAEVERAVVLQGAEIGDGCVVRDCIVAAGARIGPRTRVVGGAVLGEGVTVGADVVLDRGIRVFPGVEVPDGGILF